MSAPISAGIPETYHTSRDPQKSSGRAPQQHSHRTLLSFVKISVDFFFFLKPLCLPFMEAMTFPFQGHSSMLQTQLPLKASSKTTVKSPSLSTRSVRTMGKKVEAVPKPKQSKSRNGKYQGCVLLLHYHRPWLLLLLLFSADFQWRMYHMQK